MAINLGRPLPAGSSGQPESLDRIAMILSGAESIRDVIPFPKTQKVTCLMTQAPSDVDPKQLKELHLKYDLS